jgi:Zn-dependent protease with chaperone function
MFGNFIYFIVALLIYATFQPSQETAFSPMETLLLVVLTTGLFTLFTRHQFKKLERHLIQESYAELDHRFSTLVTRHSILAIGLFAVDIYGFNLPSFLFDRYLFRLIPTLLALLFLLLFVAYLTVVWTNAARAHGELYRTQIPKRTYVLSQIAFGFPVLLPWLLLSVLADLFMALPFKWPARFLSSTHGEMAYFLVFLIMVSVFGPLLIQKFWRCRPLAAGDERRRIEALCRRANLGYANILRWPIFGGRMITAGVMGLIQKFRYILVTDALLKLLTPNEVDAVIAHEIGHVKRKHLLFYVFFFIGYMLLLYASYDLIIYFIILIEPVYRFVSNAGVDEGTITTTLFSLITIINFLVYFRFVFGYFMRNFERQADLYVFSLFDSAMPLISTFQKITTTSGQSPDKPNWHHFNIRERVSYLQKCESDRSWIDRHERKVKRSVRIYLGAMVLAGLLGYHLNYGAVGKQLNDHFFETIILREIQKAPQNARLYAHLGAMYYERNRYAAAQSALTKALQLDSAQPDALNNLAWLYATSEDKRYFRPQQALKLAQKAAELQPLPHILDTLAESYYANDLYQQAIDVEQKALAAARDNRSYYEDQLAKFKAALPLH